MPSRHGRNLCFISILLSLLLVPPTIAADSRDVVFLHYWTGVLSGGIDDMVDVYNQRHQEAPVRASGFEHESFKVSIRVMLQAGNPPDLFSYWAGARTQALVDAGYLEPIDHLWRSAELDRHFSSLLQEAATYNGHKYLLPVTQHYVCLLYNAKLFRSHQLRTPRTWQEFLQTCRRLRDAGVHPIALGARDQWPAQFWFDYLLLRSAGPGYRDRLMRGIAAYTDPEVRRTMEYWEELLEQGYFNPNPNLYDWSEAAKMVAQGQAAMTLMGTWAIGLFEGQLGLEAERDFDFFAFPVLDPAVPDTALGPVDAIALPREGNPALAQQALLYFAEVEPQARMAQGSGALAPNQDVPAGFYGPLQQRIRTEVADADAWAFNYDLATPPPLAQAGLEAFSRFLDAPDTYPLLLNGLEQKAREHFGAAQRRLRAPQ